MPLVLKARRPGQAVEGNSALSTDKASNQNDHNRSNGRGGIPIGQPSCCHLSDAVLILIGGERNRHLTLAAVRSRGIDRSLPITVNRYLFGMYRN
jgi:hypothetical protein